MHPPSNYFRQFIDTFSAIPTSVIFFNKHKIWNGFWRYGWVSKLLLVLGVLLGIRVYRTFTSWWTSAEVDDPGEAIESASILMERIAGDGYAFLFEGSMKYIMLLLLEVVIFHVCRATMEVLTNKTADLSFKDFMDAQIRMLKVVVRSYVQEMIATILIAVATGIFSSLEFAEKPAVYLVHCYFLGFVVFDNYVEQFGQSIKESDKIAKTYGGVVLAIGLIINLLLLLPIAGIIAAPILASVTLTLVMYRSSNLHMTPANRSTSI